MAWHDPIRNWYAGLTPAWRRELRIAGLWLAFGLVAMPFLIYLAGVLTRTADAAIRSRNAASRPPFRIGSARGTIAA